MSKYIAVVDVINESEGTLPDTIDLYPDTKAGRDQAATAFYEMVRDDMVDSGTYGQPGEREFEEAMEGFIGDQHYPVGDGYMAICQPSRFNIEIH